MNTLNLSRFAACSLAALALCLAAVATSRGADEATGDKKPRACTPEIKDRGRHDQFLARIKEGKVGLLFLGDSITDGWRGGEQKKGFDEHFGKYNPANFGISGDETQHVLWRLQNGELEGINPKLVVMMIGTNNLGNSHQSPEDTAAGVHCLVAEIHKKLPEAKILLLAIFPRGREASDGLRQKVNQTNEHIAKLDGKDNVKYLDIGGKFLDPDGKLPESIMPDALHPNLKGYQIWADAISPTVDEMMK